MARLNVNPTRMELKKLKARLSTAVRGHKLLKDKSDEMIRRFTVILREAKRLREEVEKELSGVVKQFSIARSITPAYLAETAFSMPGVSVQAECVTESVMGVDVPFVQIAKSGVSSSLPYSFASVSGDMDEATEKMTALTEKLLKLAEVEKTCNMLADEIEKNRRRVNALEYVMIPQLNETIKYIMMKLDENDRSTLTRLMKVKSMIIEE